MMALKTRSSVLCALLMAVVLSACDPDAGSSIEAERDGFKTASEILIVIQDPDPVSITLQPAP
ncbi:hypothetical protein [Corallococcus exiguus]|uniref:Uncharacterized protein n=1 Tax=Corallococcus exiguus TaxID=83462 RepID=A0A7X4Y674_9BACT|nr:hypothetical protein [Corallococcus exiguus]NBC39680.1 hypothetical protein [Corallococcus exiguus]TNV52993.1 hypothetical protein FH620_37170 [Corallococcus exiguus]